MSISLNELSQLSDLSVTTLLRWVDAGILTPHVKRDEADGPSRNNAHRFTLMQCVGVLVAAELRRSLRGCSPAFVKEVVTAFATVDEKWLTAQFKQGRTHFANVLGREGDSTTPLRPLLASADYDWVDVQAAYEAVTDRFASKV